MQCARVPEKKPIALLALDESVTAGYYTEKMVRKSLKELRFIFEW